MSGAEFLVTSTLLGVFILLAGSYGVLYALGRLRESGRLMAAAFSSYALQCAAAAALVAFAPLGGWKVVIALSCLLYLPLPPLTWRYMTRLHGHGS